MSIAIGNKIIANLGGGGGSADPSTIIDDTNKALNKVYSSAKVEEKLLEVKNATTIIDDVIKAPNKVYSSDKTEARLLEVQNSISMGQSDKAKMWQKTYLNVKVGDTLYVNTTGDYVLDKVIVQPYKFIEGVQNIVETLKTFDNTESSNFFYNEDNVEFTGSMRIKDKYDVGYSYNSVDGYYESGVINKSDYVEINGIEVM